MRGNVGEVAERLTRPRTLTTLRLTSRSIVLAPGRTQHFTVQALDQHGQPMTMDDLNWEASGGTIDSEGLFTAGLEAGIGTVTAWTDTVSQTARVEITAEPALPTPVPTPAARKTRLSWTGVLPWQKWSNFYMKVLTKFSSGQEQVLSLRVTFEVTNEQGLSEQKIEETRMALRELGLDDHISVG